MSRPVFDAEKVHPDVQSKLGADDGIIAEVQAAVASNDVVVVGMKQNVFPKKAKAALTAKGVPFKYLEYGSYFGIGRRRLTLKMWTGWPTFPMIFVKGTFVGGATELGALIESGELDKMLAASH